MKTSPITRNFALQRIYLALAAGERAPRRSSGGYANWILRACAQSRIRLRAKHVQKQKAPRMGCFLLLEAPPRIELGIEVLQTFALPLGYGTKYSMPVYYIKVYRFCQAFF